GLCFCRSAAARRKRLAGMARAGGSARSRAAAQASEIAAETPDGGAQMSTLDSLLQDLVIANRILAREEVVDAYGHVSVRHPDDPKRFLIARSLAPELVGPSDF